VGGEGSLRIIKIKVTKKRTNTMEEIVLYNGRVHLYMNHERHLYYVSVDGGIMKPVIGCTTATGVLDKPALIGWAVKLDLEYLAACIQPNKKYDGLELAGFFEEAKKQHRIRVADAAAVGTRAHAWAESYIKGQKPKVPKHKKLKLIVNNFLQWVEEYKVKFLESEKKIYSLAHDYAGTIDFEAEINGELCIGDFKTSSGIWDEYRFQIAAYNNARAEETGNNYKASWIVRFAKDVNLMFPDIFETLYIPKEEHEKDFQGFLGALAAKRRLMELEREKKIKRLQKEINL